MATKLVSFTKKTKLRGKNNYAYHITLGSRANRSDITTANKKDFITSNGASYSRFNTAAGNDTIYDFSGKGNFWFLGDGNDSANLVGTNCALVDLGLGKDSLKLENAKNTTLYFSEGTKTIYSDSADEELTFDLRGATYRSEIKGKNFVVKVYDEDAEIIIGTYTFKKSAARQPTIINGTNLDDFKCDENYATDEIHEEEPPSSGGMGSDVSVVEPTSSGGMGSDVSFPTFGRETDVISPDDFFCSSPAIDTIMMDEQYQSIVGLSQSTSLGNLGSNQNLGITFAKETAVLNPNI